MSKKSLLLLFCFFSLSTVFSGDSIIKKYYNNILSGGKEKITAITGDIDKIDVYNAVININLFENYSIINAAYYIKNNQGDSEIEFSFPKIDSSLTKSTIYSDNGNISVKKNNILIKGDYIDYTMTVNGKIINFDETESNLQDTSIPYKIGDTISTVDAQNNRITEDIDSYVFKYSWYTARIKFKKNEKKIIRISYKTPHYYNMIEIDGGKKPRIKEDPALIYTTAKADGKECHLSEKIFNYMLCTPYMDKTKIIKNLTINLYTNTVPSEYLKILPLEYTAKQNFYRWTYHNLKATLINNILIKISPDYSDSTMCQLYFKIKPDKTMVGMNDYYKLDIKNDAILFEYTGKNFNLKEIRVFPEYFEYKNQLSKINLPLDFQVEFSNNKNFTDSTVIQKATSARKFIGEIIKSTYFTLFKSDDGIQCKYIRIKILKTSQKHNDIVNLSSIQILK